MVAVATLLNPSRQDFAWFLQQRRPAWLSFERLIPVIWITIYACFYGSALLSWMAGRSFVLMGGYLGLLVLVQSYTLVGLAGWIWGVALCITVAPLGTAAWLLLVPYLLWSPVGTLVTWQMQRLNR